MNKSLEIGIKLQTDRNTTPKRKKKKSSLRLYTPLIALLTSTGEIMMIFEDDKDTDGYMSDII